MRVWHAAGCPFPGPYGRSRVSDPGRPSRAVYSGLPVTRSVRVMAPQREHVQAVCSGSSFIVTGQRQSWGGHAGTPSATEVIAPPIERSDVGAGMVSGVPSPGPRRRHCAPRDGHRPAGARAGSAVPSVAPSARPSGGLPPSAASGICAAARSWSSCWRARAAKPLDAGPKSGPRHLDSRPWSAIAEVRIDPPARSTSSDHSQMARPRLELGTPRFSVVCSTN
jgi:hypothetical protein